MPRSVLICDDHPLFRVGLKTALSVLPDVEVIGEVADGEECLASLRSRTPDILLLDLALPGIDGYEVLRWTRLHRPTVRVVVLSMHADQAFADRARELGAAAFIAKEDATIEVQMALDHPDGSFYASTSIEHRVRSGSAPVAGDPGLRLKLLSPTEKRIMGLMARSLTSREIAARLDISPRTVQTHRAHIADKLGIRGAARLLETAIRFRRLFP